MSGLPLSKTDWESKFRDWAAPPGATETKRCDNAVGAVRNAIKASAKLQSKSVSVILQGSYNNNTNTKGESDVDIGVVCSDTFFYDIPDGTTAQTFSISPATYSFDQFKADLGEALTGYFGSGAVKRGNKAFDVKETSYHVEADVAPFFTHRRYNNKGGVIEGVEMRPDDNPAKKIINWPDQHYENGVAKNKDTGTRFKSLVRVLKSLRNEMCENKVSAAEPVIGFLNECMVWNTPNHLFGSDRYYDDVNAVLTHLYNATKTDDLCREWGEVSELKYLFRASQKWTRQQANDFVLAAWRYVGFK
ncbi:MAG: nucleotidyltransferase [Vitreimonas sp.]